MPETCASAWRRVTGWPTSGTWSASRSSRVSRPSSRSCISITAVNVLVLEPIRYWSSGPGVAAAPIRVVPMPANQSSSPPRATAAARPGTRPSRCWCRAARCRCRVVSSGSELTCGTLRPVAEVGAQLSDLVGGRRQPRLELEDPLVAVVHAGEDLLDLGSYAGIPSVRVGVGAGLGTAGPRVHGGLEVGHRDGPHP